MTVTSLAKSLDKLVRNRSFSFLQTGDFNYASVVEDQSLWNYKEEKYKPVFSTKRTWENIRKQEDYVP
ncbi:hypothetical protein YC2023_115061 [Brassica napus]